MTVAPLVLNRRFKAPPERVFAAFTQKALIQGWYGPETTTVPRCEIDARVGGKYRIEMHSPSGAVHIVTGEFRELEPPRKLVFTWGWLNGEGRNPETLVSVTLAPVEGGTDLRLEQTGFAVEEFRESHRSGWTSSWNSLDALLEGRPKAPEAAPVVMGVSASTYTRSVRLAFEEKGVAHRLQVAPPQTPEILAHNPYGKVPVLRVGDVTLYESAAISRYIDDAYAGPSLMPKDPLARARAEQWISAINCYVDPAFVRNYVLQYAFPKGPDGKPDRAAIETALPAMRKSLGVLEAGYGANDYLVDNRLTIPDLLLAPMVDYLHRFPESKAMLEAFPNVKRAHAAIAARPSFAAVVQ